ncbi:MAG TPA: heme o synthase [Candidatus Saccharimonadales bacterium]|nr:heme o synthase [Candidatus Saccharimonadales bacterium]
MAAFNTGTLKTYYRLTKPGIIYGNLITATGGFLLASKGHIHFLLLLETLIGISLVIGSGCVFNNYIDRGIDKKMSRTSKRALVIGDLSSRAAIIYGTVLGILGTLILSVYTNWLTVCIGLIAFLVYVVFYGISKRRSVHGTVVGSIAGAAPITAGYCAVTGQFNGAAVILFLILVLWQMPHFYSIAMYRFDDYKNAGLPVLPVKKGMYATKLRIIIYIIAYAVAVSLLSIFGYAGYSYLVVTLAFALVWLWLGLKGFRTSNDKLWARRMFFFSLIVIIALPVMLSLNAYLS